MPRNGHATTTKTAEEPIDLYDTLKQADQDAWDAIGVLGYKPEQGSTGLWFARHRVNTKVTIGPTTNLVQLHANVKEEIAAAGEFDNDVDSESDVETFDNEIDQDRGGITVEARLPGMEEPVIDELNHQADKCIDAFNKKKNSAAASKDEDDIMRSLMHKHGRKRYARQNWSMVIEDSEKLVIKKNTQRSEDGPRQETGRGRYRR